MLIKSRRPILWLIILALSGRAALSEQTPMPEEIVRANNAFALDLYAQLANQPANLILSPFSIDTALAMCCAGARGETARQMAAVLHLPTGDTKVRNVHSGFATLLKALKLSNISSGIILRTPYYLSAG